MAGDRDNTARSSAGEPTAVPAPYQSQASFVAAIRRGDAAAIRQLFLFYAPLLRDQARKMSVPVDERDELVTTLLDDVVLHLQEAAIPPRELGRYLVASLRNRARNRHRDRTRRQRSRDGAYSEHGVGHERIVAECHSAYGLRQSALQHGDDDATPLRSAIEKLATRSALALTDSERELIVGVSRHVPLRELATQAGVTYGAVRVRVHRLRERMLKLALQYVTTLAPDERVELERFFRRAGVSLDAPADPPPGRVRRGAHGSPARDDSTGQDADDTA